LPAFEVEDKRLGSMAYRHKPYWLWNGGRSFTLGAVLALAAGALGVWTIPQPEDTKLAGKRRHVFISFKHEDLDFAENVSIRLERAGFATWADSHIETGREWRAAIDLAIHDSFALIVIMTPEAKSSEYVTYEWAFALGKGIRIVPLLLRPTQMHPCLETLQYLDFTNARSRPWERLIAEIKAVSLAALSHSLKVSISSPPIIPGAAASLDSTVPDERRDAIRTLASVGTQAALSALRESLKHPLRDVRSAAAEALGEIGDSMAVPALIEALNDDPMGSVRSTAAKALGSIKDPSAVHALVKALKDPVGSVRAAAAKALGGIQDPVAAPALIETLNDNYEQVLRAVASSLGAAKDPAAVPALIGKLTDPGENVRLSAAKALGDIGHPAAVPELIHALEDPASEVRSMAAKALGTIKDPTAVPALIKVLDKDDATPGNVSAIVYALEQINDPSAAPALTEALHSASTRVRSAAARALRTLNRQVAGRSMS
jgi:HEAT repeat protein